MTDLNALLGPNAAALLTTPEQRQTATQIITQIATRESEAIARAWLIGMNPHLGDEAPLLAIADGRGDQAQAAAHAYLNGVWT